MNNLKTQIVNLTKPIILILFALDISGCSVISGDTTINEEPISYKVTDGACGEIIFQESIASDSTSAVENIKQRKAEWLGHNNFTIEPVKLKVTDDSNNLSSILN